MENYEKELASFRQQWNLPTYDLNRVAESVQALRFADSFLTGASSDNSPTSQYKKWFSRTLSIYFEMNTMPNEGGKYMSSFDAQAFYNSFKKLVQAKYDSDAQEKNETPLNVEDVTKGEKENIQKIIANCKRNYKKNLPALWQENLKQGSLKLDTLKAITDNSYDALENRLDYAEDELTAKLTNLLAAREAMKQLRASRSGVLGWLWKVIFNRDQNRQEKEYLQELNNKIEKFKNTYDIDSKVAEITGATVFGKKMTEEKTKEQPAKTASKPMKIQPVAGRIANRVNRVFYADLKNEWQENLPGGVKLTDLTLEYSIGRTLIDGVLKLNTEFDAKIANGGDPKKAMEDIVKGVFKLTVSLSSLHIKDLSVQDKAETIKAIAKGAIEHCTAVAIYPELGEGVETALNQSAFQYKAILREGKDYLKEIEKYDVADIREPAFDNGHLFAEKGGNKSAQIPREPKQSVPTLNNNK